MKNKVATTTAAVNTTPRGDSNTLKIKDNTTINPII